MSNELTFFAVTRVGSGPSELQRIHVERSVQEQLSELFDEQSEEFTGVDVEPIQFSPTYRIDRSDNEVFAVSEFEIPEFLSEALEAHESIEDLQNPFTPQAPRVKAIVGVDAESGAFFFQYFERRRILDSRRLFLFRNDRFSAVEEPAITVDDKLVATIIDGELRFKSFYHVRQFLDLSILFEDATDESIHKFLEHPKLHVEDIEALIPRLSTRMRKRFAVVLATGILDDQNITPQLIQTRAKKYTGLENLRLKGPASSRKIVLPSELAKLEKLLRFVCEELYVGDLTGSERITNSSRVITTA
ncbi:MAG: hypothetical protein ACE361_26280 [Aureliella sp.]